MAVIENLQNQEEFDRLQSLIGELKENNPAIHMTKIPMDELNILLKLQEVENKIDILTRRIDQIFDQHVLINGKFVKINV